MKQSKGRSLTARLSRRSDVDRCVLERRPNPHLVFGDGLHRCIGDVVALLELRVTLEELLARTSWFELAGEPVRTTWVRFGVGKLPLRLS